MNKTFLIVGSLVLVGAGVAVYFLMKPKTTLTNNTPTVSDVLQQQTNTVAQINSSSPAVLTKSDVQSIIDETNAKAKEEKAKADADAKAKADAKAMLMDVTNNMFKK